jgi:L-alanine-DL-glutamate epimerase-like enolase superfamily enzyme
MHIGRQTEFVKRLRSRIPDAEFIIDDDGGFNRARAREIACETSDRGNMWFRITYSAQTMRWLWVRSTLWV